MEIVYISISAVLLAITITLAIMLVIEKKHIVPQTDEVNDMDALIVKGASDLPGLRFISKNNIVLPNESFRQLFDIKQVGPVSLKTLSERLSLTEEQAVDLLKENKNTVLKVKIKDELRSILFIVHMLDNSETIIFVSDVTDQQDYIDSEQKQLQIDPLTGFISRYAFKNALVTMSKNIVKNKTLAMYVLDIDNFKEINNRSGHFEGDQVIKEFAKILSSFGSENKAYIRMAGDNFIILHGDISDSYEAKMRAEQWLNYFKNNFIKTETTEHSITFSCGIALYDEQTVSIDRIYEYADFALYQAKKNGSAQIGIFNMDDYEKERNYSGMLDELNRIIDEKDVYHVYLPVIEAKSSEIIGYEALLRTNSDKFKNIQELFNFAQKHNRTVDLNKMSIEVLADSIRTKKPFKTHTKLFVNLQEEEIVRDTAFLSHNNDIPNTSIVFELSGKIKSNQEIFKQTHQKLARLGYGVSLDDFGTGYLSELSLLTLAAPLNYVKIDMHLIRDIQNETGKRGLVKQIIRYAHEAGSQIIAEGVETINELETLMEFGIDIVQGFYFGKPAAGFEEINKAALADIARLYFLHSPQNETVN